MDKNILLTYAEVAQAERTTVGAIRMRVHRGTIRVERNGGHPRIPLTELSLTARSRALELIRQPKAA